MHCPLSTLCLTCPTARWNKDQVELTDTAKGFLSSAEQQLVSCLLPCLCLRYRNVTFFLDINCCPSSPTCDGNIVFIWCTYPVDPQPKDSHQTKEYLEDCTHKCVQPPGTRQGFSKGAARRPASPGEGQPARLAGQQGPLGTSSVQVRDSPHGSRAQWAHHQRSCLSHV